jgi:hypothetical protein
MSSLLEELLCMYMQDFELVFVRDTDPIDLFCQQHTSDEQRQLLCEMKELYDGVARGEVALRDIRNMGLEYLPGGEQEPKVWLPRFVEYLQEKVEFGSLMKAPL